MNSKRPVLAVAFFVPGDPRGKERARSSTIRTRAGQTIHRHYTPAKTRAYEKTISDAGRMAMHGRATTSAPVVITLSAIYPIPKSWPKWKREMALRGEILPTVKPDIDNIEKAVKDALNGIAWTDDSYVVTGSKAKYYCNEHHPEPGLEISLAEIAKYPAQITKRPREVPDVGT